jgi:Ca2+-binding EF-hand superfamily protein
MDGDPAKTMGLIAHPGAIRAIAISYDGRKIMTAGEDGSVNIWSVGSVALQGWASTTLTPEDGIARWEKVIDNPELVQELKEYFLYAQIKSQGEDSSAPRAIRGTVPASMLPDLCCAAGFYPSKGDVADMMSHITFMSHVNDRDTSEGLTLEDVLAIYVNFRPLQDVSQDDLARAFLALGANPNTGRLARDNLLGDILQKSGEAMTLTEVQEIIKALTGATKLSKSMPNQIDANAFASDILGFDGGAGGEVTGAGVSAFAN